MHAVQISPYVDVGRRTPEELLVAWPTLAAVAAAVAGTGIRVSVVQAASENATHEHDGVVYEFVSCPVSSHWRQAIGHWAAPVPRLLAQRLEAHRPDVIHLHSLSFPRHARLLSSTFRRTPILAQDHADRAPQRWERPIYRAGFRGLGAVAFTAREQAQRFLPVLPRDVRVFEVLESSTHFTPGDAGAARAATGLRGDPCVVWLGRLDGNKDPLTVLDALSSIIAELPDAHLWCFFRTAPLLTVVERRVHHDPRLQGRVHLMGECPHETVEQLLRAGDFLVQASHTEGSGYSVIEALACGAVPVVTDIPSLRRITGHGSAGALFPPGDATALARALIGLTQRDRAALRHAARAHFEQHLSFESVGRDLREAYEAVRKPPCA